MKPIFRSPVEHFNDDQEMLDSQFNPFIRESLPPIVLNIKITKHERWGECVTLFIPHSCLKRLWAEIEVEALDVSAFSVTVSISEDDERTVTFVGKGHEWFMVAMDLKPVEVIVRYKVSITMEDFAGNELDPPYEKEMDGLFGGVLRMMEDLWDWLVDVATAIVDAVAKAVSFLLDIVMAALMALAEFVFSPVYSMFESFIDGVESIISREVNSLIPAERFFVVTANLAEFIFTHPLFWALFGAFMTLLGAEVMAMILSGGTSKFLDFLAGKIIDIALLVLFGVSTVLLSYAIGEDETIQALLSDVSIGLSAVGFAVAFYIACKKKDTIMGVASEMMRDFVGAIVAIFGMLFVVFVNSEDPYWDLYADLVGITLGLIGVREAGRGFLDDWSISGKAADAIAFGSFGVSMLAMLTKTYDL